MREGLFIKKNIDKWKQYQYDPAKDPDEMAGQFTDLVNDLGYAKTFYPQSKVTQYLNGLASRIYLGIYRNKKEEVSRIARFWKTELPLIVRKYHREIGYSFLIFLLFAVIAAFSAAHDESFVRGVLGDQYVDMTEENIAHGDPFGVYKRQDQLSMFFFIAVNNIQVSFTIFVLGFLVSIGTVWQLFRNGVMVGAFQYYFFAKGLGWQSVLVIWIHGTLEISAIIISGAAGIVLGNSILFPGTHRRVDSLKRGGKDLSEQFAMRLSLGDEDGHRLFVVQATFRQTFGFLCVAATMPGQAEGMLAEAAASTGGSVGPFVLLPATP